MQLSKVEVAKDLRKLFPEIYSDDSEHKSFLDDYAAIGSFLSSLDAVRIQLSAFEDCLEKRLLKRLGYNNSWAITRTIALTYHRKSASRQFGNWKDRLQAANSQQPIIKRSDYSKLVSDELADNELQHGFSLLMDHNGHQKPPMIMPLAADKFRSLLVAKRPFKDPTIGYDHGEYTHRVQWYLISKANILANRAGDVYAMIGKVVWEKSTDFGLWDAICDRQPKGADGLPQPFPFYKANAYDFRTPEALLTFLCSQTEAYPLLAGFLSTRKAKRIYVSDNDSAKDPLLYNYTSRKLFNRPYDMLREEEKGTVNTFLEGSQNNGILHPKQDTKGYLPEPETKD